MQRFYLLPVLFFYVGMHSLLSQCPPAGFPSPGDQCGSPVLCENIDGYCAPLPNVNIPQNFPGCSGQGPWELNNPQWFGFYAGTTTISLQISPSNCPPAQNQGMQGAIYSQCTSNDLALQCACTEDPFTLSSSQFVIGEIYWIVVDGCGGNTCDYLVEVTQGSTVPAPPDDPGPINGPIEVCVDDSENYSIAPPTGATEYAWTLDPPGLGTINGDDEDISISWGGTAGTTELCVQVSNFCETNPNLSCVTIEVFPEPTADLSGSGEVCESGATNPVELTIDFTGTAPWTVTINTPNGPEVITTSDNPYIFTVEDPGEYSLQSVTSSAAECEGEVTGSVEIEETVIEPQGGTTTATCEQSNGEVDITGVNGGEAPYTYNWDNGEMTEDLINVPSGSYTVTVTDANGCEGTATFEVDELANEPTVTATTTSSECGLENGSIDVSVSGGSDPYTYEWNNGETTEDLEDVPSGSYTITVTGADGCTTELTVDLDNVDPPINVSGTIVANTTCNGGNGSITTTVSPTPPPGGGTYTYEWDNGATTPNLEDLEPGTYTVTVSTGNSCEGTASFTIPDEPDEPQLTFSTTESICELENGSIDVSVSGGVPPYTFSWGNGETSEDLDDIPEGTYNVTVTGANGCTDEAQIDLSNNNPPITVTADIDPNEGCGLGNWNGSITITINPTVSPTGQPYVINWSTGETTTTISDLEPGSYTVTVNGGGGCETIQTFSVNDQPDEPQIAVVVDPSECGLENGSATISISGSEPPYDILWSNGNTTNSINDVPAGSYSVTVTGANGCSAETPVVIGDEPILFDVTAEIDPNTGCNPASQDGSITITINPPTNPYIITWSNGATGVTTLTDLNGGSYSVTIDAGGTCTEVFNFAVPNQPDNPGVFISTEDPFCGLNNGMLIVANSGGGAFPFTYQWSNGATTSSIDNAGPGNYTVTVTGSNGCTSVVSGTLVNQDIPIDVSADVVGNNSCLIPGMGNGSINLNVNTTGTPTITWSNGATGTSLTDLDPGTYTVTVSVGGNCEEILPVTVPDISELPSLTVSQTPATCGLPDGEADLNVIGGEMPYTFLWSNGETTEDLNGVVSGGYSVTVTTATGCTAESFVNINENTLLFNALATITPNTSCGAPIGIIELFVVPNGNYTYQWFNGETAPFITDLTGGVYEVTITAAGNCVEVFQFEVPEEINPPNVSITSAAATCGLENGSVDLTVTGAGPFTFQWSNGASSEDLTDVPPGTYSVLVSDANFCLGTAEVTVASNNVPINISGTPTANTLCGSTSNGALDITIDPPGTYDIEWSNGETTEDLTDLSAGTYEVTISSGADCESTASFTVEDDVEAPEISEDITAAICNEANGEINLTISGGTDPYTFEWSNSSTEEDQAGLLPGPYTVTVTDANDCTSEETFNVTNNSSSFSLNGDVEPLTSCVDDDGSIDLTITPAGTYTIEWSNGAMTEDLDNLPAGTYEVVVTESGSCSASATFVIEDETTFPSIAQNISPELCGQEDGQIDITVTGGEEPYSFAWSNGSTEEDLVDVAAGTYSVVVTGANGCTDETTVEVPESTASFSVQGTPSANTSCDVTNGSIDISVTPPGTYTFEWSNGEITEDLSGLAGGSYSVIVSAGGDCTATANFTVPSTTEDPVIAQVTTASACGESNGGIDLTITGGQAPFNFLWSNGATTEDLEDILSGSYSVEVTGANGCVATASFNVPDNPVVINLTGTATPNNSCDTPNGTIAVTPTPASGTYTYLWSNGETTQNLNDLPPGNYTVTVFEGANCEATANFIVGNDTNAPDFSITVTNALCGQSTGALDLSASGGTTPYTFLWSNGETTEDLADVPPGAYDVTLTGADGCSNTGNFTVGDDVVDINITGTTSANTVCVGSNGVVDIDVSPADTYTYLWSNGETTEDLVDVPAGTYTVTVSGIGTCSAETIFVVENDASTLAVNGLETDILCFGENTGSISVNITGGVPPYDFEWSPGIPGNPEDPTDLFAGDYSILVTDADDCTAMASFTIDQPVDAVQIACTQSGSVSLPGMMDGEGTVTIFGGTAPYSISWSPGGTQDNVAAGDFVIDNLGEGIYDVTVIDANGCQTPCDFTISTLDCVTAVGTMSNNLESTCGDGCLTGTYDATNQFLDPDDILEYVLHTGAINQIVDELARNDEPTFCFDFTNMNYGVTYYISAVAGNDDGTGHVDLGDDCTVVSIGTPIVFIEDPEAAIIPPNDLSCDDPQVEIQGSSSVPGSVFSWETTNGEIVGNPNTANIQVAEGGDYTLIVEANGCFDTAFVNVVDVSSDLTADITASPTEILDCTIDMINLTGSAVGAPSVDYSWEYNGQEISTDPSITVDEAGVYTLTVTDPISGCQDIEQIEIDDNTDFPPLDIAPPPTLNCLDSVGTLSGSSTISNVEFFWATINGTDTVIIGNGADVQISAPGTYYLIGVASNDCTNIISVEVDGNLDPPSANAGDDQSLDCYQTPIELTGSSNNSNVGYFWTTNDPNIIISDPGAQGITVDQPGVYTLTVTQLDNNCEATDEVVVELFENVPQADLDIEAPDCFGDTNGSIFVDADPANGPYEFTLDGISNGDDSFFAPLGPGNYELVVTDGQGCTWSTLVYLPEAEPVIVELGTDLTVELGESVVLQAQYTVPTDQLDTILWSPSELFPCPQMPCDIMEIFPIQQTSVEVTVVDTNGCEGSDVLTLIVNKDRQIYIPNAFSPNGDGTNDVFMIYSDDDVLEIKSFLVFSRWGETVFEYENFTPNNPAFGWDGKHRGEVLNPAVFAWFAEVEFIDGQVVLFEGDVTLVR